MKKDYKLDDVLYIMFHEGSIFFENLELGYKAIENYDMNYGIIDSVCFRSSLSFICIIKLAHNE